MVDSAAAGWRLMPARVETAPSFMLPPCGEVQVLAVLDDGEPERRARTPAPGASARRS